MNGNERQRSCRYAMQVGEALRIPVVKFRKDKAFGVPCEQIVGQVKPESVATITMGDNGFPVVNYSIKPVCEEGCGTQQNKKEEGMKCPIGIMGGKLPQGVVPFEPLKVLFQG